MSYACVTGKQFSKEINLIFLCGQEASTEPALTWKLEKRLSEKLCGPPWKEKFVLLYGIEE